jgi:hypothetical protein
MRVDGFNEIHPTYPRALRAGQVKTPPATLVLRTGYATPPKSYGQATPPPLSPTDRLRHPP